MQQPTKEKMMIRGYQYGADKSFVGIYDFHNNEDKEEIHMPPNTTLKAPPIVTEAGKEAAFDEVTGEWFVREEDLSWIDPETRRLMAAHQSQLADQAAAQGSENGA